MAQPGGSENTPADRYQLIGAEESPYSVKVRSYLRYKSLPHDWLDRSQAATLYQQHARLPLIPLLVTPDGRGLQDSTGIIEAIEQQAPQPTIHPIDEVCRFLSFLLEEFADEWGNKWMFHYRWAREVDQLACALRLARMTNPGADATRLARAAASIRARMIDRIWFVGSSVQTAKQIEESFRDSIDLLDLHLSMRPYLFGGRPAFADFALWGQLYNMHRDPTPHEIIRTRGPQVQSWIERMQQPALLGEFERWETLAGSLQPFLKDQIGGLFLPWSAANAQAIENNDESFSVRLYSGQWQQKPQTYQARSLRFLRQRYQEVRHHQILDAVLSESGCLEYLI